MSLRRWFFTPQGVWRLPWRLVWTGLTWLTLTLVLSVLSAVMFALSGSPRFFTQLDTSTVSAAAYAWMAGVAAAGTALTLALAARFWEPLTWDDFGLRLNRAAWRDVTWGFAVGGLMQGGVAVALYLSGVARWHVAAPQAWPRQIASVGLWLGVFALIGWYEEALLRGYLYTTLNHSLGRWSAAALSSLVFAGLHAGNPGFGVGAFIGLTLVGLFFVAVRRSTPWGVALPVGVHWGWNFFEGVVFGFPVSGLEVPTLGRMTLAGPEWWTGGAFGPEAGVVVLVALAVGWALLRGQRPNLRPSSAERTP